MCGKAFCSGYKLLLTQSPGLRHSSEFHLLDSYQPFLGDDLDSTAAIFSANYTAASTFSWRALRALWIAGLHWQVALVALPGCSSDQYNKILVWTAAWQQCNLTAAGQQCKMVVHHEVTQVVHPEVTQWMVKTWWREGKRRREGGKGTSSGLGFWLFISFSNPLFGA